MTWRFCVRQLVAGDFSYEVFVKAQAWTGTSQIESRPFRVSAGGLSVVITGPERIGRDALYTYHVAVTSCETEEQDAAGTLTVSGSTGERYISPEAITESPTSLRLSSSVPVCSN